MSNTQIQVGGNPTIFSPSTAPDENGGGNSFIAQIDSAHCIKGQLLAPKALSTGVARPVHKLPAGSLATAQPCGLAKATQSVGGGDVHVQFSDIFTMTADEWDAIAGTSGGLITGTRYYADRTTAGNITGTAPTSGQAAISAGVAMSATDLFLTIGPSTVVA